MPWILANWRSLLAAALVLSTFGAGYKVGANGVQQDWDAEHHQQVVAQLAAVEQNQKTITELEAKYAKSAADLERLRATPADRVHLPKAACPDQPIPAGGSAIPAPGPERASNPAQDALGEAQSGMESDAIEWARALNACQVVMRWADGFGK